MKWLSLCVLLGFLGGCSCDAVVAIDDDAGGPSDGGPDADRADASGTDGGGADSATCFDADGDGVTDCDGDCDDADPLTFPGAAEVCGDGVDNACGSDPDPAATCAGIGTHVSTAGSDAMGDGTRDNPVRTIAQGIANAVTIGGATTVVVAGGTYDETVTMIEGVSIQGGFDCASLPCSWAFDPAAQESIIDGGAANGVDVDDTITRATHITNATILSEREGVSIRGGGVVLRSSKITAQSGVNAFGAGTNPLVDGCTIVGTRAGISIEGEGTITSSDVEGAPAVSVRGAVLVERNVLHASGDTGVTIYEGAPQILSNIINEDASRVGTCSFGFCAGVSIWGGSPLVSNNVIYGMGGDRSAAIAIVHGELVVERPLIHSNTLYPSRIPGGAGSINAGVSCHSFFGLAMFGELRNNLIVGQTGGTSFGFYEEDHDPGASCRPVLLENNALFMVDHAARFWTPPGDTLFTTVADANAETWATDNLTTDPMLDAAHRLQAGSGCIDVGTTTGAPSTDRDGDARPAGSGFDIGADERP